MRSADDVGYTSLPAEAAGLRKNRVQSRRSRSRPVKEFWLRREEIGSVMGLRRGRRGSRGPQLGSAGLEFVETGCAAAAVAVSSAVGAWARRLPFPTFPLAALTGLPAETAVRRELVSALA